MQSKRLISSGFFGFLALGALMMAPVAAQDTSSVHQAFQLAQASVRPALRDHVVSIYGLGDPAAIQKWYMIFYDPTVGSHGQAVLVQNGAVVKTYEARGGAVYSSRLTFNPARITSEQPVLNAAQNYASQHNIAYDSVRALLKPTGVDRPFRWRIELVEAGRSCGFVFINPADDTIASYQPPASPQEAAPAKTPGDDFGDDVKRTFLHIGGSLQQFFTGQRTVDR